QLWFGDDAVAGYATAARRLVVAGAPICPPERLAAAAHDLESFAAKRGRLVCYFGAGSRLERELAGRTEESCIPLGAQPVWDPRNWPGTVAGHASLRAQLNRARNKRVRVDEWAASRARNHPALRRVLEQWLKTRG